jgi:hypothetical protein
MPFSFPASPSVGDTSTQNGRTYSWSGYAWEIVATPAALSASVITSGTLGIDRIPTGTSSSTVCVGNDSRLSDSRTPTSHTHGNITNAGAIGSTADQFVVTTTSGVLTAVSAATARTTLSVQPTASPAFTGTATFAGQVLVTAGSVSACSVAPSGDPNTGLYFPSADVAAVVTNGTERVRVGSGGRVQFFAADEKFGVQLNKGATGNGPFIGSDGADILTISTAGGAERVRVKATGAVRFVPLSADPSTGNEAGDVYYNSTTNKLRVYNGTSWVDLH